MKKSLSSFLKERKRKTQIKNNQINQLIKKQKQKVIQPRKKQFKIRLLGFFRFGLVFFQN